MSEKHSEEKKQEKIYTIRGLNEDLYESFSGKAKDLGITVGELMNQAMGQFLLTLEVSKDIKQKVGEKVERASHKFIRGPIETLKQIINNVADFELVSNISELTVSRSDLELAEKPLIFSNIKKLEFSPDVDVDLINAKVRSIKVVDEVVIPSTIPVLVIAKKCQLVKRIVQVKQ